MRWKRRKRWALERAVLVAVALLAASVPTVGCFAHQCDPSKYDWDGGRITQDNTYETNAIDEPWLDYPGNVTIRVHYPVDVGDAAWSITLHGYLGLSQPPDVHSAPVQTSEVAGQLAEYSDFNSQGFTVLNASCSHYTARFVVHFDTPLDVGGEGLDAGTAGGADTLDEDAGGGAD
jgi:hypothetical protein